MRTTDLPLRRVMSMKRCLQDSVRGGSATGSAGRLADQTKVLVNSFIRPPCRCSSWQGAVPTGLIHTLSVTSSRLAVHLVPAYETASGRVGCIFLPLEACSRTAPQPTKLLSPEPGNRSEIRIEVPLFAVSAESAEQVHSFFKLFFIVDHLRVEKPLRSSFVGPTDQQRVCARPEARTSVSTIMGDRHCVRDSRWQRQAGQTVTTTYVQSPMVARARRSQYGHRVPT